MNTKQILVKACVNYRALDQDILIIWRLTSKLKLSSQLCGQCLGKLNFICLNKIVQCTVCSVQCFVQCCVYGLCAVCRDSSLRVFVLNGQLELHYRFGEFCNIIYRFFLWNRSFISWSFNKNKNYTDFNFSFFTSNQKKICAKGIYENISKY